MNFIANFLIQFESVTSKIRLLFFRTFFWVFKSECEKWYKKVGLIPNGPNPWDPQYPGGESGRKEVLIRLLAQGSLGLGETYMEGLWEVEDLEEHLFRICKIHHSGCRSPFVKVFHYILYKLFNLQTKELAKKNTEMHYEINNNVLRASIGPSLNYTSADWRNASNLEEAQTNKMELIAQKLKLKPGMRVLDIGCVWGALCKYLAEKHGVTVVGITICKESVAFAKDLCKGLPIEIHEMDYRDAPAKLGQFDRVTCIEMLEHVGEANYATYFETVKKCLAENGIFLLQTTAMREENKIQVDPFINKYIFENGMLSCASQIVKYSRGFLAIEDWMFWGYNYHPTLMAWWENFEKAWPALKKETGKNESFYRMWKMYLMVCAAGYRARLFDNYQIVFSKDCSLLPYYSVR